jgi:hypothetical protein
VVFVRGSRAPSTGEEDAVVCWVTGGYVMIETDPPIFLMITPIEKSTPKK